MKKFILFIFVILFNNGCGFAPIYEKGNLDFSVEKISLSGDSKINSALIRKLDKYRNNSGASRVLDLQIAINDERKTTSKDEQGNDASYKYILNLKVIILEKNKVEKNKEFTKEFNYSRSGFDSEFKFNQYEKDLMNGLLNKILTEIELYIMSN